ncbi:MAG: hypothetical protein EA400_03730 [Chromatiaceae bacterium]|nr:MAG: hypothetical protein EA400_03730 [Chromatiaceae bacterium]
MDQEHGKPALRALLAETERLSARVAPAADAWHRRVEALAAALAPRLRPFAWPARTAQLARWRAEYQGCAGLADDLIALLAEIERQRAGEQALLATTNAATDGDLAGWFAARAVARTERLGTLPVPIADRDGLEAARQILADLGKASVAERNLLDLYIEAAQRAGAPGAAAGPTRDLAAALPGLRAELLASPRIPPGQRRLPDLLAPARALDALPKPGALQQVFPRLEGLRDWLGVLRDGADADLAGVADAGRDYQRLRAGYQELARQWRTRPEAEVNDLLARLSALETRMLALGQAEQVRLMGRLTRALALFEHVTEPSLSAALDERIRALRAQHPTDPAGFRGWREAVRMTEVEVERALEQDAPAIVAECERLADAITRDLAVLAARALPVTAAARREALRRELAGLRERLAEQRATTLIDTRAGLVAMQTSVQGLLADTEARAHRHAHRLAALEHRARRLATLAAALALPPPPALDPLAPAPTLNAERRALIERRAAIIAAEEQLRTSAVPGLATRLGALRAGHALLATAETRPPLPTAPDQRTPLRVLQVLSGELPRWEQALEQALATRADDLDRQRAELREQLAAIAGAPGAGPDLLLADRDAAARLAARLVLPRPPAASPRSLIGPWQTEVTQAAALVERLDRPRLTQARHHTDLRARLERLRADCFELDAPAPAARPLLDRVWALLAELPGVEVGHGLMEAQLQEAERLLAALEQHGARLAAASIEQASAALARQPDPVARTLLEALRATAGRPDAALRRRAYAHAGIDPIDLPLEAPR